MNLADFYNYFKDSSFSKNPICFIIGTGPSNRVFPLTFIDRSHILKIGLNQAYKFIKCNYNITIHPHCIPLDCNGSGLWFTKIKESDELWKEHQRRNNPSKWILFNNTDAINSINSEAPSKRNTLFVGRGIQTGGLHLAAHMGARYAVLVGCDMCQLAGDHHATDQHVQFHNIDSKDVYNEYYYYTAKVRKELKKNYNMDVLTLSPFLGQKHADMDYAYLCKENNLEALPLAREVEFSSRNTPVVKGYIE